VRVIHHLDLKTQKNGEPALLSTLNALANTFHKIKELFFEIIFLKAL
jgi:hypothetical protein